MNVPGPLGFSALDKQEQVARNQVFESPASKTFAIAHTLDVPTSIFERKTWFLSLYADCASKLRRARLQVRIGEPSGSQAKEATGDGTQLPGTLV